MINDTLYVVATRHQFPVGLRTSSSLSPFGYHHLSFADVNDSMADIGKSMKEFD
jgi:hypothetical protein